MSNYRRGINNIYLVRLLPLLFMFVLIASSCFGFKLPMEQGEAEPFVFLFMSDAQADPQAEDYGEFQGLLIKAMESGVKPELLILGGDTVNDGADLGQWRAFWQASEMLLSGVSVAAAAGNHDGGAMLAEQFDWPETAPSLPGRGYFYSFDMNEIHFTVLDSNIMGAANPEDIAWLKADLSSEAALNAKWRIAVCHHPFWPVAAIAKNIVRAQTMREHFLPLLEEYGVDLLLVGHEHLYARSLPQRGGQTARRGLVQIMAASGSKDSYTPEDYAYLEVTYKAPNYVLFIAEGQSLSLTAYDGEGRVIDTYTLIKES